MDKKLPLVSGAEDAEDARRVLLDMVDEDDDEEEEDASSIVLIGFLYWRSPMARDMLIDPVVVSMRFQAIDLGYTHLLEPCH